MVVASNPIVNRCNEFRSRGERVVVVVLVLERGPERLGRAVVNRSVKAGGLSTPSLQYSTPASVD